MGDVARRIVTGHNAQGKSIFIADGPCPHHFDRGNGNALTELWWEDSMPVDNSGNEDCGAPSVRPRHAARTATYSESSSTRRTRCAEAAMEQSGRPSRHYIPASAISASTRPTPSTTSIVLEGEIYALMDEGEKLMKQGDVLIQRGTTHAWSNRTDKPCYVMFVLIDAKPAP